MLSSGSPLHLAEWREYAALEPWGDDWERASLMTARLVNSIMSIAAGFAGSELSEMEAIEDDAFVPKRRKDMRTKKQILQDVAVNALERTSQEISELLRG